MLATPSDYAVWAIVAAALAGVVLRPFRWPEAIWAVAAAILVAILGLIPLGEAARAIGESADVCLFLAGMMLLAETARLEGLFDWIATYAVSRAGGSTARLFALVWLVGVVVTTFLSNDATAVVLTPAVLAVTRAARAPPAPFLLACAFVANAASFVLPMSNPANLVVFASHPPALAAWIERLAVPAAVAIAGAFAALRLVEARALAGACEREVARAPLSVGGRWALAGIVVAVGVLMTVSALGRPIGAPTFALGVLTAGAVLLRVRAAPWPLLRGVTWSILPLTAALFVLVQALETTGLVAALAGRLDATGAGAGAASLAAGVVALVSNLANNLPVGLLASHALAHAHAGALVHDAVLIGVDLGPNLSVTGSLATILWLAAIRREGQDIGFWRFLRLGALVMPASLLPALAARLLIGF
ncbi:MAG: SLC13 family permease [Caulobacteraceae bacterium]